MRPAICWAILIVLTIMSVMAAESMTWKTMVVVMIFGVAILKGQLIAIHFMEVDRALPVWNTLYRVWIVAIGAVLMLGHLIQG
jgi:hypothetical protein